METPRREPLQREEDGRGVHGRPSRAGGGEATGRLLLALSALACPLLCLGPLLLAGLASTGLARALQGAPWPLIVGAALVLRALGVWGGRARQTRDCCAPAPSSTPRDGAPR
jgi:hypothetical protein